VWGWDTPGETVTISIADQTLNTRAGADGRWQINLEPLLTTRESCTLTIKGSSTVAIADVLVGEVWLGSGQSPIATAD
jgi:sialate O-acetylesterase